jgi:membrane protease YdiL (CAAX protease family)
MESRRVSNRILFETLAVMAFVILLSILFPQGKGLFGLLPIAYFLVERQIRKRKFDDIGFRWKNTWKDLKHNWHLVLLVAVVTQLGTLLIARVFVPDFFAHVRSRVPVLTVNQLIPLVLTVLMGTFAEEIVYRGFAQERLCWFVGPTFSVLIASAVFSSMHFSPGTPGVIAYDLSTIFIDSLIYGLIYHRTKNIFASWVPHLLADFVGVALMLTLFK